VTSSPTTSLEENEQLRGENNAMKDEIEQLKTEVQQLKVGQRL